MQNLIVFMLVFLFVCQNSLHADSLKMISCKSYERIDSYFSLKNNTQTKEKTTKLNGNNSLFKIVKEGDEFQIYERDRGNWLIWGSEQIKKVFHSERKITSDSGFVRKIYKDVGVEGMTLVYSSWIDFLNPQLIRESRMNLGKSDRTQISEWNFLCKEYIK